MEKVPLAQQYHIQDKSLPPWLIARDGTLISREAKGMKLETDLVVESTPGTKIKNE